MFRKKINQGQEGQVNGTLSCVTDPDRQMLLKRHVQGDPSAFPELVEHYRKKVYAYLVRCGVDTASRDDLFQDIFINIHKTAKSFQSDKSLNPWLFTIVANTVRAHYRKQRVRKLIYQDELPDERDPAPDSQAIIEARETAGWLDAELLKLPFSQRETLLLSVLSSMDQKTIATVLSVPLSTVKTNLRRARQTLAKAIIRRNRKEPESYAE